MAKVRKNLHFFGSLPNMSSACKGQRQHRPKILQFWNVNMFPEESSLTRKGSCDNLSSPCHCYKYWCMYCDVMWWWWLWWWRLESSMLLLPSLRGGEWNTEPEWHLERSARTMLDFSVKIQQRWLNMAVQNRWQYYEDMTKDFMRGIHVQMSLRKPQTYINNINNIKPKLSAKHVLTVREWF